MLLLVTLHIGESSKVKKNGLQVRSTHIAYMHVAGVDIILYVACTIL